MRRLLGIARCATTVAGLAIIAVGAATGQDRDVLQQRIDRLTEARRRRLAEVTHADSAARARIPLDTIRVGAFHIIAGASQAPAVAAAADSAWRTLERSFSSAAGALSQTPFVINVVGQAEGEIPASLATLSITFPPQPDRETLTRRLIGQGAQTIGQAVNDSALVSWMGSYLTPAGPNSDRADLVYMELVTAPWSAARACYTGDRTACRRALGLLGRDDPILSWYDAADRRTLVRTFGYSWWQRLGGALYQRCVNGGPDADCEAALRALPAMAIVPPLSGTARLHLLETALELGGAGAYDRLLASARSSMETRLAEAAMVPGDSLIALWRGRALAARPTTVALRPSGAWAAVLWGTLLGVLALRSTRWR
jgi:hypothetical protein